MEAHGSVHCGQLGTLDLGGIRSFAALHVPSPSREGRDGQSLQSSDKLRTSRRDRCRWAANSRGTGGNLPQIPGATRERKGTMVALPGSAAASRVPSLWDCVSPSVQGLVVGKAECDDGPGKGKRAEGAVTKEPSYNFSLRARGSQKVKSSLLPHALSLPSLACLIGFPLPPTRLSLAPGKYLMVGFSPPPQEEGWGLGAALPFIIFPGAPATTPCSGATGVPCRASEKRTPHPVELGQAGSQGVSVLAISGCHPEVLSMWPQLKPAHLLQGLPLPRVPGLHPPHPHCHSYAPGQAHPGLQPRSLSQPRRAPPDSLPTVVLSSPSQKVLLG